MKQRNKRCAHYNYTHHKATVAIQPLFTSTLGTLLPVNRASSVLAPKVIVYEYSELYIILQVYTRTKCLSMTTTVYAVQTTALAIAQCFLLAKTRTLKERLRRASWPETDTRMGR